MPLSSSSDRVYIRVCRTSILPIGTEATQDPPPPLAGHLYVIEGTLEDIVRYAGDTARWVLNITRLICDPSESGGGRVYTHTAGTASTWYALNRTSSWQEVAPDDPLLPHIYEYNSSTPITLSKISERHTHSITSLGLTSSATTFSNRIRQRDDNRCIISHQEHALVASHLIPKRMGDDGVRDVVARFCGVQAAIDIHKYDPRIGVLLLSTLDKMVDLYQLGFYHETDNMYRLHDFAPALNMSALGITRTGRAANINIPPLHLDLVTLSAHDGSVPSSLPAKGTFDWHYLQCVIQAFGTPDYRNLYNIRFRVHPESDGSGSDGDSHNDSDEINSEPSWPTYHIDRFLLEQARRQVRKERDEAVAQWSSMVPSGI